MTDKPGDPPRPAPRRRKPAKPASGKAAPAKAPDKTAAKAGTRGLLDEAPVMLGGRGEAAPNDKFDQFDRAYIDADTNYDADIKAAQGNAALIQRIDDNLAQLSAMWSRAKRLKLEANNDAIAAALANAKSANKAVKDARAAAAKIVDTIGKVDAVVGALASLTEELAKV